MENKDDIQFMLSQYLDGQLNDADEAKLMEVMKDDPSLRADMQHFARLDELLLDMRDAPALAKVDFAAQRNSIMGAIERKALLAAPRRPRIIKIAFSAMAAAAAVAVASSAYLFFQGNGATSSRNVEVSVVQQPASTSGSQVMAAMVPTADDDGRTSMVASEIQPVDPMSISLSELEAQSPPASSSTAVLIGAPGSTPSASAGTMWDQAF